MGIIATQKLKVMVKCDTVDDRDLTEFLKGIDWKQFLLFGSVKIQVRDGKATLVTVERTVKLD